MKRASFSLALLLCAGAAVPVVQAAEESAKTLPTLVIKGEVVSVDTTDPAASVLKVKDRYGFETPIHLTADTKISQGETAVELSALKTGASVEVEYNFDINTAKRHAVRVSLGSAAAAPAAAEAPATTATTTTSVETEVTAPAAVAPAESKAAPAAAPAAQAPAAPATDAGTTKP